MKLALLPLAFASILALAVLQLASAQPVDADVQEAKVSFEAFLKTWLIDQDVDKALTRIAQSEELNDRVKKTFKIPSQKGFDLDTWLRKTLVMWLIKDHGTVNSLGHGNPLDGGYDSLPVKPADIADRIRPKTLAEAMNFKIEKDGQSGDVLAFVQLRHAPRDIIIFQMKNTPDGWKIVFYIWMII